MKGNWEPTMSDFIEYCKIRGVDIKTTTKKQFNIYKKYGIPF